ncbi:S8 family serine peptidase [Jiangella mangrovi]|uniref:Subtilisin family serine protease n=1 Tax=Jiangella mangrovi TaxID=1524084 RepID=A0A7W9LMD1_9ACTN|nr:S8 family serine peptidase [Jiangella mangrovi]MBB5788967.1 subtilisin family serine protease [Jiangella mangrovi]
MDPALWQLLRAERATPDSEIEAIVRLRDARAVVPGVRLVARFGRIATCRLPVGAVPAVRRHPAVRSLKASRRYGPDPPVSLGASSGAAGGDRPGTRRPPELDAAGLTGDGVVVGVVDWWLDVDHPAFRDAAGRTRLLALWDQRSRDDGGGPAPEPYGYGRVHDRAAVDAALRTGDPYDALGYHPAVADRGGGTHGTHVAAIATGVAPGAELVFVHLADRGTGGLATLGDSVRLLEAVDFVRRTAGRRPWVVNLSVGRHGGPHDGRTLFELALDELLRATTGALVVQSAGNYFRARAHAAGTVAPGATRTLTFRTRPGDPSRNELEIWYDGGDRFDVRLTPPGRAPGPWVRLGEQVPVRADGDTVGRLYHRAADPNNHDRQVDAFLEATAPAGDWTVSLRAAHVRDGRFHAWLERDDRCAPCQPRFVPADVEPTGTIGTIATGRLPLVVGAYDARDPAAPLAPFSSTGPTRDGRGKPDLVAPGVGVLSARSAPAGSHRSPGALTRKSGTSMAAPHVTGAVALCLQATGGRLGAVELRRLVLDAVRPAPRASPPGRAGAGYLDLARLAAVLTTGTPSTDRPKEAVMAADRSVTPSQAFRELLYRPGGELASWVGRHFAVLARPGEDVAAGADRGDLLVDVPLGRPGPGTVTTLPREQVASWRLGPGQLLLRPLVPDDAGLLSPEETPTIPAHVTEARKLWPTLFKDLPKVVIRDLAGCAPSAQVAGADFTAWTNSPTAVYVSPDANAGPEVLAAILYHESLHVRQFMKAGGKPPADHATMMRYEVEAYTDSARWADARPGKANDQIAEQLRATARLLRDAVARTTKATKDPVERNRRYQQFLISVNLLPEHRTIGELYALTPGRMSCSPSGSGEAVVVDEADEAMELLAEGYGDPPGEAEGDTDAVDDGDLAEFSGREHRDITDNASGKELTSLTFGDPPAQLTFGEVTALAGDYFATFEEMRDLSRTAAGRIELAYARWHCLSLSRDGVAAPTKDAAVIQSVTDRYLLLASRNISHFSGGGTAWQAYTSWHAKALVDALDAGRTSDAALWRRALTKEAFGLHFLTDSFSAGHVRTPRAEIRDWYQQRFPDSGQRILQYLARFLFDRLDERQQLPQLAWWFGWVTRGVMVDRIRTLGGEAVANISLGDIVSLALHDVDNLGLDVVSDVDADGKPVAGGHHWRAMGDGHLGSNRFGIETRRMAVVAVIASLRELERVRGAGVKLGRADVSLSQRGSAMRQALGGSVFAARAFVPREDVARTAAVALRVPGGGRAPMEWRWGSLGPVAHQAIDATIRKRLADELLVFANQVPDPVDGPAGLRIHGIRSAYRSFIRHLRDDGITVLERAVGRNAR